MALTQNTVRNFKSLATSMGTKTSHSLSIGNADGKTIGMIQSWAPTRNRGVARIFELNQNSSGFAIDLVPGTVDSDTLSVTRVALWRADLFNSIADAFKDAKDWTQQKSPFEVKEVWAEPSPAIATDYKGTMASEGSETASGRTEEEAVTAGTRSSGAATVIYFGCWFTDLNPDAYNAQGDKFVTETATIEVLGRSYA